MDENSKNPFLKAACLFRTASSYKLLGNHKRELECLSKTEEIAEDLLPNPRTEFGHPWFWAGYRGIQ
ncbi:MAG: hypothetical protein HXS48_17300 [Theionarchaea archaeon]|nr:MAG: hypothetical protein AYK19_21925 [Theionarchaea archaeon DG-70-1]MBU7028695.1 hypothetical protein [Theionarchaea archaeon]